MSAPAVQPPLCSGNFVRLVNRTGKRVGLLCADKGCQTQPMDYAAVYKAKQAEEKKLYHIFKAMALSCASDMESCFDLIRTLVHIGKSPEYLSDLTSHLTFLTIHLREKWWSLSKEPFPIITDGVAGCFLEVLCQHSKHMHASHRLRAAFLTALVRTFKVFPLQWGGGDVSPSAALAKFVDQGSCEWLHLQQDWHEAWAGAKRWETGIQVVDEQEPGSEQQNKEEGTAATVKENDKENDRVENKDIPMQAEQAYTPTVPPQTTSLSQTTPLLLPRGLTTHRSPLKLWLPQTLVSPLVHSGPSPALDSGTLH